MQIVTTPTVPGHRAVRSYGLVSGREAILGANIFRDLFAGVRDIIGGRSAAYEKELRRAKGIAIDEMSQQAAEFGANAIVGVDLDYETIDVGGGMLMVSASGTATSRSRPSSTGSFELTPFTPPRRLKAQAPHSIQRLAPLRCPDRRLPCPGRSDTEDRTAGCDS